MPDEGDIYDRSSFWDGAFNPNELNDLSIVRLNESEARRAAFEAEVGLLRLKARELEQELQETQQERDEARAELDSLRASCEEMQERVKKIAFSSPFLTVIPRHGKTARQDFQIAILDAVGIKVERVLLD